jgi:hypothetical protein
MRTYNELTLEEVSQELAIGVSVISPETYRSRELTVPGDRPSPQLHDRPMMQGPALLAIENSFIRRNGNPCTVERYPQAR